MIYKQPPPASSGQRAKFRALENLGNSVYAEDGPSADCGAQLEDSFRILKESLEARKEDLANKTISSILLSSESITGDFDSALVDDSLISNLVRPFSSNLVDQSLGLILMLLQSRSAKIYTTFLQSPIIPSLSSMIIPSVPSPIYLIYSCLSQLASFSLPSRNAVIRNFPFSLAMQLISSSSEEDLLSLSELLGAICSRQLPTSVCLDCYRLLNSIIDFPSEKVEKSCLIAVKQSILNQESFFSILCETGMNDKVLRSLKNGSVSDLALSIFEAAEKRNQIKQSDIRGLISAAGHSETAEIAASEIIRDEILNYGRTQEISEIGGIEFVFKVINDGVYAARYAALLAAAGIISNQNALRNKELLSNGIIKSVATLLESEESEPILRAISSLRAIGEAAQVSGLSKEFESEIVCSGVKDTLASLSNSEDLAISRSSKAFVLRFFAEG